MNKKPMEIYSKFSNKCWSCKEKNCGNTIKCEMKFTCKECGVDFKEEYVNEFLDFCDKHLTTKSCYNCSLNTYCVQEFILKKL